MLALFASSAWAGRPAPPPHGWRYPSATEASQAWRTASPHRHLLVTADFDGDGLKDSAALLLRSSGSGGALVVLLGRSGATPLVLESLDDPAWLNTLGVDLVAAGRYRTACGKGYWDCDHDEPEELLLDRPAIDLFTFESANSYFFFDGESLRFRRVWISDCAGEQWVGADEAAHDGASPLNPVLSGRDP